MAGSIRAGWRGTDDLHIVQHVAAPKAHAHDRRARSGAAQIYKAVVHAKPRPDAPYLTPAARAGSVELVWAGCARHGHDHPALCVEQAHWQQQQEQANHAKCGRKRPNISSVLKDGVRRIVAEKEASTVTMWIGLMLGSVSFLWICANEIARREPYLLHRRRVIDQGHAQAGEVLRDEEGPQSKTTHRRERIAAKILSLQSANERQTGSRIVSILVLYFGAK